jgi:hypothetical protein
MERNSILGTGLRTVSAKGTITATADMEDDEVIFEMEKGLRMRLPAPPPQPKYRSRWMRRQQTATMGTQTMATNTANLAIKMEGLNLEKKRETELQQEILRGSDIAEEAGEAQKAVEIMLEEQAPSIGYCHECGWWHELPRSYSFQTSVRTRGRQHGRLAGRAAA